MVLSATWSVVQDVKMVAWHPSGQVLASASYDDTIKLWVDDGDEWVCQQTLSGACAALLGPTARLVRGNCTGQQKCDCEPAASLQALAAATPTPSGAWPSALTASAWCLAAQTWPCTSGPLPSPQVLLQALSTPSCLLSAQLR